jgi:transmembrane sensor
MPRAAPDDGTISKQVLTEAATWLMEMHEGPLSPHRREQLAQWRQRSDEHERAWEKAAALLGKFEALPPAAASALRTVTTPQRRAAITTLVALLVAGPAGWLAYRGTPWPLAGTRGTATGERLAMALDDGSRLTLNTDSAVDIEFDRMRRVIHLRRGEILIDTARDGAQPPRPFVVMVREGAIRALGTRFTVRQFDGLSRVAVLAGAVAVSPRDTASAEIVIPAGRQAAFSRSRVDTPVAVDEAATAWKQGMLIADRMAMSQVVEELDRYRPGTLLCDPAVASLKVSGAFPLADIGLALSLLEQTHPVKVRYVTRFWARVGPA